MSHHEMEDIILLIEELSCSFPFIPGYSFVFACCICRILCRSRISVVVETLLDESLVRPGMIPSVERVIVLDQSAKFPDVYRPFYTLDVASGSIDLLSKVVVMFILDILGCLIYCPLWKNVLIPNPLRSEEVGPPLRVLLAESRPRGAGA